MSGGYPQNVWRIPVACSGDPRSVLHGYPLQSSGADLQVETNQITVWLQLAFRVSATIFRVIDLSHLWVPVEGSREGISAVGLRALQKRKCVDGRTLGRGPGKVT